MTVWIAIFCRGCFKAVREGLSLYAQSGMRI